MTLKTTFVDAPLLAPPPVVPPAATPVVTRDQLLQKILVIVSERGIGTGQVEDEHGRVCLGGAARMAAHDLGIGGRGRSAVTELAFGVGWDKVTGFNDRTFHSTKFYTRVSRKFLPDKLRPMSRTEAASLFVKSIQDGASFGPATVRFFPVWSRKDGHRVIL